MTDFHTNAVDERPIVRNSSRSFQFRRRRRRGRHGLVGRAGSPAFAFSARRVQLDSASAVGHGGGPAYGCSHPGGSRGVLRRGVPGCSRCRRDAGPGWRMKMMPTQSEGAMAAGWAEVARDGFRDAGRGGPVRAAGGGFARRGGVRRHARRGADGARPGAGGGAGGARARSTRAASCCSRPTGCSTAACSGRRRRTTSSSSSSTPPTPTPPAPATRWRCATTS